MARTKTGREREAKTLAFISGLGQRGGTGSLGFGLPGAKLCEGGRGIVALDQESQPSQPASQGQGQGQGRGPGAQLGRGVETERRREAGAVGTRAGPNPPGEMTGLGGEGGAEKSGAGIRARFEGEGGPEDGRSMAIMAIRQAQQRYPVPATGRSGSWGVWFSCRFPDVDAARNVAECLAAMAAGQSQGRPPAKIRPEECQTHWPITQAISGARAPSGWLAPFSPSSAPGCQVLATTGSAANPARIAEHRAGAGHSALEA